MIIIHLPCDAGEVIKTITSSSTVDGVSFSDDDKKLVVRAYNEIVVYDILSGNLIKNIKAISSPVSSNGDYFLKKKSNDIFQLISINAEDVISSFSGFLGEKPKNIYSKKPLDVTAIGPDGKYLAVCSISKFSIKIWNTKSSKLVNELDLSHIKKASRYGDTCKRIIASPKGNLFAVEVAGKGVYLITAEKGKLKDILFENTLINQTAFSGDGKIFFGIDGGGNVLVWNVDRAKLEKKIFSYIYDIRSSNDRKAKSISANNTGKSVAIVSGDNIEIWDIEKETKNILTGQDDFIQSVSYSQNGEFIVASSRKVIKIWSLSSNAILKRVDKSRVSGIVYKNKYFWQGLYGFEIMHDVFDGRFDNVTNSPIFKVYYLDFLSAYYNTCIDSLPHNYVEKDSVMHDIYNIGVGTELLGKKPIFFKIYMEPRFEDKYEEYKDSVDIYMSTLSINKVNEYQFHIRRKLQTPGITLTRAHTYAANEILIDMPKILMRKFFENTVCKSATMQQMKENLWRVAHGKSSLQDAGIKILNAEKESVSTEEFIIQKTFYQACKARGSGHSYCICLDNKGRKHFSMKEVKRFSSDFKNFEYDVVNFDVNWRLRTIKNACLN